VREWLGREHGGLGDGLLRVVLRSLHASFAIVIAGATLVAHGAEDGRLQHEPAAALLDRAFANLYAEDYIQTMELSTQPRSGRGMTRLIQITRKQSVVPGRALIRFLEPYAVRRTSVLILENDGRTDDLFVYLPATRLTRHLSNSQRADSFFGTDLAYEDIEPKYTEDYDVVITGQGSHAGIPCIQLELRNRPSFESTYDRLVSCVEEKRGVILWTDFYRNGTSTKRLEVDPASIRSVGTRAIPFSMTVTDLRRRSKTAIATTTYDIHTNIPDALFSTWNLEAGDARRDRAQAKKGVGE
jgi:hypothetical protein